jgi:hypothetical protein
MWSGDVIHNRNKLGHYNFLQGDGKAVNPSPFFYSAIAYGVGAGTEEHSRYILRGHL